MTNWKGWIIKESLKDKKILSQLKAIEIKTEKNRETGQTVIWHLYTVEVEDKNMDKLTAALEKQMKFSWYAHFTNFKKVRVIFKGKSFKIRLNKKPKEGKNGVTKFKAAPEDLPVWKTAVKYAITKGKIDPRYLIEIN